MILKNYILREHIGPFFTGLLSLTFILIMNKIFIIVWDVVGKGLKVKTVLLLLSFSLPSIIALTVPMAVLVAVFMAFGRLSQDSEITVIRASGIDPVALMLFPFITAVLMNFGMVWFNNHTLPEANHKLKNLSIDIAQKRPSFRIKALVMQKEFEGYDILVRRVDYKKSIIYGVTICEKKKPPRMITAKEGTIFTEGDIIRFNLTDGEIHELDPENPERYRKLSFKRHTMNLPFNDELIRKERAYRGDRELSARVLKKKADKLKKEGKRKSEVARLMVEYHKKYAIPFACIVFIIMGAPLAMRLKRGGVSIGFGLSLVFFIFYYICLIGGEQLGDRCIISPWLSMWFPNIVVGLIGLWFTYNAHTR
jgi:lipopolysaccharide export system permease protein